MYLNDADLNTASLRPDTEPRPLENVLCCQDLPEPVSELPAKPEFGRGYVLDGRFYFLEALYSAGMATLYRAEDMDHGRRNVVIKIPFLRFESDPASFAQFRREEEIGLKLNHPYVLKFIPVENKSRSYIVTEYLRGCTLDYIIHKKRPLPEGDALKITSVICKALQHLHGCGIIHNDLKPSNIMICSDRTLRVMDFGLATQAAARRGLFGAFAPVFGTPQYMAPEQVRNRRTDARTDVYTLGAMLFEMLTGQVPFQSDDHWDSVRWRLSGDPPAPRHLNPLLSPSAEEIVLHAMQRRPADRYQSVAAFKADLDSPERVHVTGFCHRLKTPRWKLSFEGAQLLNGLFLGVGALAFLVVVFLCAVHFAHGHH
ncbi:MAG: serine/threonine-protein kinase [Opitutaceae bacterium]|jgi:serine/threonine-protein kinase